MSNEKLMYFVIVLNIITCLISITTMMMAFTKSFFIALPILIMAGLLIYGAIKMKKYIYPPVVKWKDK